ncbi:MAG: hypothetical protein ACOCXV_00480 [Bacteroidota bacterium]
MIRYLKHSEIDFDKWDDCIERSINGIIYPLTYYLNQVSPRWEALVYGDYQAVMPLPVKKKLAISYLVQPPFVQQIGVFSPAPVNEELVKAFISAIPHHFRYVNIKLNTFNPLSHQKGIIISKNVTYELDLIAPYEQIIKHYSQQTLRNLKRSEKEKVFVTENAEPEPVMESFRQNRGRKIPLADEKWFLTLKHLVHSGLYRGNAKVYSAYDAHNTFCAGVIFFASHNKVILIFSGSTPQARKNGAMTAIIDRFIRDHAGKNLILDFEGSNQMNLARFYAGFGSKECVFLQVEIYNFPLLLKPIAGLYFTLRKQLAGY